MVACRGPAWGTPPMAKVMRKEAWHTQRCDQASGNPLFPSIYPKTRVCFMLSPITISLGEGVNLQLQLIKIPGRDKSVSAYGLLWRLSTRLYRFVPPHVIVYSLPTWEAGDVLDLLKANSFGELEIISIVLMGRLGIILVKGFFFIRRANNYC